ncbi:hypothetical protein M2324_003589 [Rhodovulum sulfidophilum]|uniref:hypothetical protein n=1 Tax=Rhodovulum sulfidophilum TaxID=35806 RepID=UPI0005A86300|nr:hypothetical protein [Rhodovulum sulfidophilum]ANB35762.1 hypothetical protein A6W98_17840 [Rhodovulum sulfidophilum DSM 1374]ANB39584.1 hypothetical protein A6024_17695 [Rhodovulum sulfidophilum]MCW2305173.1 hypothetical protein [Rhodovulum sulfidophilum]
MKEYSLTSIRTAMAVADAAEKWGEATLELNGYSFNLTDTGDSQLLSIIMQHEPSADKVRDLLANLTEAVKNSEVSA